VHPDSIIMELSDPTLQNDAFTAEATFKQAQADYDAGKVKTASDLMTQKSAAAQIENSFKPRNDSQVRSAIVRCGTRRGEGC